MEFLNQGFYGNTVRMWFAAAGTALAVSLGLNVARGLLATRLAVLARKTDNLLDDLVVDLLRERTRSFFVLFVALFIGSGFLILPAETARILRSLTMVAVALQAAIWGNAAITFALTHSKRFMGSRDPETRSTYGVINFLAKLVLWVLVGLVTLHNLGVNITALVAGLGVGGVAVALALQNILGDLFASISIVLDKPFEPGDTIVVDNLTGTVEHVGLKTTRLRSVGGEEIVFSNADLLKSRIRNLKRMTERRVIFSFGVLYETPADRLAAVPGMVREVVGAVPQTRFERAHLLRMEDSALAFEVSYLVTSPDAMVYMDAHHEVNIGLVGRMEKEGIRFAYPTRSVVLRREESL